jgi:hypothetical protein|tara:strand:- start:388 stop:789 length:402 start_codon:yes stop_codon:yes gene_type:complete
MRLKFIVLLFFFICNSLHSQKNPKKLVLDYYSDIPFQYVSSNDELTQVEIGLFVREVSIDLLNKFLEDFSKNIEEKNGYLVVINLISSKQINIQIPFSINQEKLNSLRDSKENFEKICNFILNDSYEWIIRYI